MSPLVSVLLLTRDGAATLPELLDALGRQDLDGPVEVVAVDSGSRDGTRALLADRVDRLVEIAPDGFGHGRTRNLGLAQCRGELVVLLVQDVAPVGSAFLRALTAPLRADPRVAGAFARQLPRPGASALTRDRLARWVAAGGTPRRSRLDAAAFARLSPWARHAACAFDDVAACVRRAAWAAHPYPEVPIAEDLAWAKEVLLAGWELAFVPEAEVVHSHERPVAHELVRTRRTHRELARLFGLRAVPGPGRLAVAVGADLVRNARLTATEPAPLRTLPRRLGRAAGLAVAWPLGQYLGGVAGGR